MFECLFLLTPATCTVCFVIMVVYISLFFLHTRSTFVFYKTYFPGIMVVAVNWGNKLLMKARRLKHSGEKFFFKGNKHLNLFEIYHSAILNNVSETLFYILLLLGYSLWPAIKLGNPQVCCVTAAQPAAPGFCKKFKFHNLKTRLHLMRGVATPARPPGRVPLAPSKPREPLMRLIGINGTGEEALTDCVTDGAGNCWRLLPMEINDYLVSSAPSSAYRIHSAAFHFTFLASLC